MQNNDNQSSQVNSKDKSLLIKPFKKMHKGALLYYILAYVVLFFNIFTLKQEGLTSLTYRVGYQEFAYGIGWIYYLANLIGILTVISPLLGFLTGLATKIIPVVNLVISGILLFKTIPDTVRANQTIVNLIGQGELAIGFYLILGLHIIAVLIFWFTFIRKISKKRKSEENL